MSDTLGCRIESFVDGEVWNDDRAKTTSSMRVKGLHSRVGCDCLGFALRADSIAHIAASCQRSKKDTKADQATGTGDKDCGRHLGDCTAQYRYV